VTFAPFDHCSLSESHIRTTVSDTTTLSQPTSVCETRAPWVRGLVWDSFWLQSALWLAPLAMLLAYNQEDLGASPLDLLVLGSQLCSG